MTLFRSSIVLIALAALALTPAPSAAQTAGTIVALPAPPAAASGASGAIDVAAATRAYLDLLTPEQKAKSDAYFEGGYWLTLWGFLWTAAVLLLILQTGLSARMRDLAERIAPWKAVQSMLYAVQFVIALTLATLPWDFYTDYVREHQYSMSNLTAAGWLGEQSIGLGLALLIGSIGVAGLYGIVRRVPRTWWIWGSIATIAYAALGAVVAPIWIQPLYNHPTLLGDQRVVQPILVLARANGIPATEVWQIDASKQTKRMSANVSGLLGTERITLNDNLLNRASLPEIEAVMGHEMGHYVLNHVYKGLMEFGIVFVIGFALVNLFFERLRVRYEAAWRIRGIGDVAGLPLLYLLFYAYLLVMNPVANSIVRTQEYEADMFGLNASHQPDGFAQAALHLSEYRKMEPGPLEEIIFYDHPSGRTRIHSAMRWKAEHPETWSTATAK